MAGRTFGSAASVLLLLIVVGIVFTLVKIQTTPTVSDVHVNGGETLGPRQRSQHRFYNRTETFLLTRRVNIKQPAEDVFAAVMAPQLWTLCYPETLAVGGVSRRRIREGDVVFEKYLFNGLAYVVFRYDVEKADPNNLVRFHGIPVFANTLIHRYFDWVLHEIGGSFDYTFQKVNAMETIWIRDLYLYTTSQTWFGKFIFWLTVAWIRDRQEAGATQFLECTKLTLESMEDEVWAELRDH